MYLLKQNGIFLIKVLNMKSGSHELDILGYPIADLNWA